MQEQDTFSVAEIEASNFSQPWTQMAFSKAVCNDNYIYIVALDGPQIVGYAGCLISCDEGDITNIAVLNDYRRMGIASELLKQIFRLASEKGVVSIFLEVRQSNTTAQSLYNSIGFEMVGIRKDFYQKPSEDAIVMKYDIKLLNENEDI